MTRLEGDNPFNRKLVGEALKAWHNPSKLAQHPLTQLNIVESRRASNYANIPEGHIQALRDVLQEGIRQLGPIEENPPNNAEPSHFADKRWRSYNILTQQYIKGRNPDFVAAQLSISLSRYHNEKTEALNALIDILRQREAAFLTSCSPSERPSPNSILESKLRSPTAEKTQIGENLTGRVAGLVIGAILVCLVIWVIYSILWSPLPIGVMPSATIIGIKAEVQVKRKGTDRLIRAGFGQPLYPGDVVSTYDNAAANIICENGLLFGLPEKTNLTVDCQNTTDPHIIGQLDPTLNDQLAPFSEIFTDTINLDKTRTALTRQENTLLLLSPRNTVISDTQPTFHWQPMAGATGYQLSLIAPSGQSWSRQTTATRLTYPADESPLAPGNANVVILKTLDDEIGADETVLQVLDEANLTELTEAETAIQSQAVDTTTKGYLLAQLYRQRGMWAAAITELERLADTQEVTSTYLFQQLGNFYFEIELFSQAGGNYQIALVAAEASGDQSAQATAHIGLARTAHALGHTEQALDHLTTAEAFYHQAGEMKRAEMVAAARAKLEKLASSS